VTALLVVALPLLAFASRYRLALDGLQGENCLPYTAFLVDLKSTTLKRGDYLAFVSQQMEPFYRNGTMVVKQVTAVPGDRVSVDGTGVRINGRHVGSLLHLESGQKLWRLGRRVSEVAREEIVPAEHFWVMGTHPRSYDSRYWGYIRSQQVVGRAIALW
jgi:conjugal transfer pilin signal peptidase TrbI